MIDLLRTEVIKDKITQNEVQGFGWPFKRRVNILNTFSKTQIGYPNCNSKLQEEILYLKSFEFFPPDL